MFTPPYPFGQVQARVPPIAAGKVPVVNRINTDKPYVFVTIDDGAVTNTPAPEMIMHSGVRPTLFLNQMYVRGHEEFFKRIRDQAQASIGNHTVNHPLDLRKLGHPQQRKEICDDSDAFERTFGQRPTLFRPPGGNYNDSTLTAAAECGLKVSVGWTATVNDGRVDFQQGRKNLQSGDIILLHFRAGFAHDYTALLQQIQRDHLNPVPLADFLG